MAGVRPIEFHSGVAAGLIVGQFHGIFFSRLELCDSVIFFGGVGGPVVDQDLVAQDQADAVIGESVESIFASTGCLDLPAPHNRIFVDHFGAEAKIDSVLEPGVAQAASRDFTGQRTLQGDGVGRHVNEIKAINKLLEDSHLLAETAIATARLFGRVMEGAVLVVGGEGIIQIIK